MLINDGSGNFTQDTDRIPTFLSGLDPNSGLGITAYGHMSFHDADHDGSVDIILGNVGPGAVPGSTNRFNDSASIIYNDGLGNFTEENAHLLPVRPDTMVYEPQHNFLDMEFIDLNNDGLDDIIGSIAFGRTGGSYQILVNNGDRTYTDETDARLFGEFVVPAPGSAAFWFSLGDYNGDGYTDIAREDLDAGPFLWLNDGEGYFQSVSTDDLSMENPVGTHLGSLPDTAGPLNYLHIFTIDGQPFINRIDQTQAIFTGPDFTDPSLDGVPHFNEQYYLRINPDARAAVDAGTFATGLEHYLAVGQAAGLRYAANIGSADNDQLFAGEFGSEVLGNGGDDILMVNIGDDTLNGGSGRDILNGNAGLDILIGGAGADVVTGGIGDDELSGNGGNDQLNGDEGNDLLDGGGGRDRLDGGLGNDDLIGGDAADTIFGGEGDDTISGRRGSDFIDAGAGNDFVAGRGLTDVIFGGGGDDDLRGNGGRDTLNGDAGNDTLIGGQGNDTLDGGADDDFLDGRAGDDSLSGGAGIDVLFGKGGNDTFIFAAGHDQTTVMDFRDGEDTLDLTGFGFAGVSEATALMSEAEGNVSFTLNGDTLIINNITIADLTDDIMV